MPFVGGEGGRGAFSTWFLTYFDSRLQFKAIFYFTSLWYIGNQLQIEIVSYGCSLFPSKIGMQPYRIFCDPFQGFPPPPSPPPSKKRRKIRTLSHKCIQYLICVAFNPHSLSFSQHSDCSKLIYCSTCLTQVFFTSAQLLNCLREIQLKYGWFHSQRYCVLLKFSSMTCWLRVG